MVSLVRVWHNTFASSFVDPKIAIQQNGNPAIGFPLDIGGHSKATKLDFKTMGVRSLISLVFLIFRCFEFDVVYSYTRPPPGKTIFTPQSDDDSSPEQSNYDMLLLPGDLSYADKHQKLWDSFGRLVEPLASQRPWMVTQGNHEVEKIAVVHSESFTAYNARWKMPYEESGSDSNLYYSFDVAGVHVIMLGSYTEFDSDSTQYKWLQGDLKKVNRKNTPWLVVLVHAPWYNSNTAHQGEKESVKMKDSMEDLLYQTRVDVIFEGHVHAYERFQLCNHVIEHLMLGDMRRVAHSLLGIYRSKYVDVSRNGAIASVGPNIHQCRNFSATSGWLYIFIQLMDEYIVK
ncbi:unnamed protein product [Lupinus luteus]|uniref:acid phosphatase n=1 Tax=Lupinus luteus TaxID=3873 RepID=A0AAV1WKX6_LUPLU